MMKNSTSEDALNETIDRLCLKRVADPDEIAKSILFYHLIFHHMLQDMF